MADEEPKIRWLFEDEPNPGGGNGIRPKPLGLWSGGEKSDAIPPPRDWLLGNTFCRGFLSSLVAEGGTGKSALRMTQALALATGRPLTGEKVFEQTRVLYISLEDDAVELKRRLRAALLFHDISPDSIRDWLFLASPGDDWDARQPASSYTLAYATRRGEVKIGEFLTKLSSAIYLYKFGLVVIDPFIKLHALNENSNAEIDFICRVLASVAMQYHVAIDLPHHTSKLSDVAGGTSRSNRARGGSAFRDAVRLLYTLSPMTADEALELNVNDDDRRSLVRLDPGKLNITVPATKADWFRLMGVKLGNGNDRHPNGDEVQTVTTWDAPDFWAGLTISIANQILDALADGLPDGRRYSTAHNVKDERRQAWRIVQQFASDLSEAQAKMVIHEWGKRKMIEARDYDDPTQKNPQKGLFVLRRPG
jgi:hypothetical protein